MDMLSIFGVAVAVLAVSASQYIDGADMTTLLNLSAFIIVFGGTLGAVMVQTPWRTFFSSFRLLKWVLFPPNLPFQDRIRKVVTWNRLVRKSGLIALDKVLEQERCPFSKKGLESLLQGADVLALRRILEVELDGQESRALQSAQVFESMGGYAPTIGIIGAVLGLIQVMGHLSDPSALGGGIAVAFVATIYGVALANLLFLPIAHRLKTQVNRQALYHEMIIEGLISIALGDHPEITQNKLHGYVSE